MKEYEIFQAQDLDIKSLYRYQPFDIHHKEKDGNKRHEEWLIQTLRDRKIKLSNPADFNDPWDSRVWYNDDLDNPKVLEGWIRVTEKVWKDKNVCSTEDEYKKNLQYYRDNPPKLSEQIHKQSNNFQQVIDEKYRVLCLSKASNNIVMWSHYADHHKGICFEFDCKNKIFGCAYKVNYEDTYPLLDISQNDEDHFFMAMITKAKQWAYEEEFRFIAMYEDEQEKNPDLIKMGNDKVEIPENSIKSIIIGCKMDVENKKRLIEIIQEYDSTIKIKEARHVKNRYDLSIEDVIA